MKSLITTLCTLAAAGLLLAAPLANADCADENGCRNRPETAEATNAQPDTPQTRALKKKPKKECAEENGCNNRPEASAGPEAKPQTRALKKKPKKEACADENTCR